MSHKHYHRKAAPYFPAAPFAAFARWIGGAVRALLAGLRRSARFVFRRTKTVSAECRAHNFPESNRFLVQLVLLVVALAQYAVSLVKARLLRRRHFLLRSRSGHEPKASARRKVNPAAFMAATISAAAVITFFSLYTIGTTMTYKGESLGVAKNKAAAAQIAASVETATADAIGMDYTISAQALHFSNSLVHRSDVEEAADLEEELTEEIGLITHAYSLYVNDELIGSTLYPGALEDLLEQIQQVYVSGDTLSVSFAEDVRVEEEYIAASAATNLGKIAEVLNSTKSGEVTYTVVGGDTWGAIAMSHGMTNDELFALNPGYNIDKLSIGDVLTISNAVPYLTVVVTERQNYIDDVAYEIHYVDDPNMYRGDYRVLSAGQFGKADVVADVVYVNGIEDERSVLSSVMLTEPVAEERAQGTKERPSWMATGSFRWPTTGRITSYFGYRNTGIKGASTNHMGIDIAVSYGTPIYAADGGTITYSGWWGSGGYTIIIDHGNGYKTYYEHCSALLKKVGDHAYKGEQIARVGTSGVSSGAHCHFGIQKNGSYVNPLNYLP